MPRQILRFLLAPLAALSWIPSPGRSAPAPKTIGFTGVVTDSAGKLLADGSYTVQLSLYDTVEPNATASLWREEKTVRVTRGLFSTALGDQTPFPDPVDFSRALFVGIRVGADPEMQPRLALQAVPYALYARSIADDSVGPAKLTADPGSLNKISDGHLTLANGKLGIGNANPPFALSTGNKEGIATSFLRLQDTYLESGATFGMELAGVDNGQNGHDLRVRARQTPTGAFSDVFIVRNNGYVGINMEPSRALSVNGSGTISGPLGIGTSQPAATLDARGEIRFGLMGQYFPVAGKTALHAVYGNYWTANGGSTGNLSGFSVTRNGIGDYTVAFHEPFAYVPSVSIQPWGNYLYTIFMVRGDRNTYQFRTYANGTPTEADGFNLMAIGPR